LQSGKQNGCHEKSVCTIWKNLIFENIFFKKYSAGGKQAGAKIRAHGVGPALGFSLFAVVQNIERLV